MSFKVKLQGFEELLENIDLADKDLERVCNSAMTQAAYTMHNELKSQMSKSGVPADLVGRMPAPKVYTKGNNTIALVGYETHARRNKSGELYDNEKVAILNYGTGKRFTKSGANRGEITQYGFIQRAKRNANRRIKKQQSEVLAKCLERLKK